jgi:hypothetical protein
MYLKKNHVYGKNNERNQEADHTSRCIERHPIIKTSSRKFLLTLRTKRSEYGMTEMQTLTWIQKFFDNAENSSIKPPSPKTTQRHLD